MGVLPSRDPSGLFVGQRVVVGWRSHVRGTGPERKERSQVILVREPLSFPV